MTAPARPVPPDRALQPVDAGAGMAPDGPAPNPTAAPAPDAPVPGPRAIWTGAPVLAFRRDPLGYLTRLARTHGDVVRVRVGPLRLWLLAHPEQVRQVLVTEQRRFRGLAFEAVKRIVGEGVISAQGAAHRRQRRLVQPAFHRERMPGYGATMADHAARWAAERHDGEVLALREAMTRLTLAIVGETMFGADEADAADDVRALIDAGIRLYGPLTLGVARWMERLPIPAARQFVGARARLDARVARLLAERRQRRDAGQPAPDDLLGRLLVARDAADGEEQRLDEDGARRLDDRWVRDEVMTIFLAGHETTASALTWCWWLLAQHPDAERRLHAECDAVLGVGPAARTPTPADLARLPYATAVFREALRLWPPAALVFRRAVEPCTVQTPAGAWTIPAGDVVVLSQWVTQRDPRWWPEPDAFRPERWLDESDDDTRPRFAAFPFGGGARVCIGEQFAIEEGVLVLAAIASRWRLRLVGEAPPGPGGLTGTRPPETWQVRVERRD